MSTLPNSRQSAKKMHQQNDSRANPHAWVKPVTEYVPLIGFFLSYWWLGLHWATAVLVVLTVIATFLSRILMGKLPLMPMIAAALVVFFGGLTLVFNDERFIKMKPTIVQLAMAGALIGSACWRKPLLKIVLGSNLSMPLVNWQTLSYRFATFFIIMAAANEYIWRYYSTDFWVNFKFFGLTGLTFVFSVSQVMYIMRHAEVSPSQQDADPDPDQHSGDDKPSSGSR